MYVLLTTGPRIWRPPHAEADPESTTPLLPPSHKRPTYYSTNAFPPYEYWDKRTWRAFTRKADALEMVLIWYLGLQRHPADTPNDLVCTLLDEDTNRIAHRLWALLYVDDLFECAADPNYLVPEIDVLLAEYAPYIWGMDANRSRLLTAGEHDEYPKDLVLEDDDDRQLLWLHFYRWIFGKAICVLKTKINDLQPRLVVLSRMAQTTSRGSAFLVSDRDFTFNAPLPPHEDAQEPNVGGKHPAAAGTSLPYDAAVSMQCKAPEEEQEIRSGSRLTGNFLAYLQKFDLPDFDEDEALSKLESTFSLMFSRNVFAQDKSTLYFSSVFPAWLRLRRAVADIKAELEMQQNRPLLLERLDTTTHDFVKRRLTATHVPDVSAEEVVRLGFGSMSPSLVESERVMKAVRTGFEKLNKDWLRLRTELSKEE
jgi:hypothetical protein